MNDVLDYMVIIIDSDGNIVKYPMEFGKRHQDDCYDIFALERGYEYSNLDYIISRGNCVFYNCGNQTTVFRLPSELTDEQLYSLDYIENWLDNVLYMEVCIENKEHKEYFVFKENVRDNFSNKVIQYYYNNISGRTR